MSGRFVNSSTCEVTTMAAVWRRKSKPAYNWLCQEVRLDSLTIDNKENKVMAVTRGEDGLVRFPNPV